MERPGLRTDASRQAVAAGVTAALLGYASSVAVVVAGLVAVGASPRQVSSALLALGVAMAVTSTALSWSTRIPVAVVWSTPGLALLATAGPVEGGFPAVLGGLAAAGLLIAVTGMVRPLTRALQRLPAALTSAVLAGVLLPFCLAAAQALGPLPLQAGIICAGWLLALRLAPSYAAPAALLGLLVVVVVSGDAALPAGAPLLPRFELTALALTAEALTAVALPVYLVTMAAQNLVGIAVLSANGYRPPVGGLLVATGATSAVGAPLGMPTVNLAAITGALTAGPPAHPDPGRRWVACVAAGLTYLALGALSPLAAGVIATTDPRLVATAAGLGLFGPFTAATAAALQDAAHRVPAAVTLLVTASGLTAVGLGSAPLGLAAGLLVLLVLRPRSLSRSTGPG